MISARLAGDVLRQTLKPCSAAATAAARSAVVACGTVPMLVSSAGLMTGWPGREIHSPLISSFSSG